MSIHTSNRHRLLALALGVGMCLQGSAAFADDTEIFFGRDPDAGGKPNILFVIDTSGSMGTNVVTQVPYDPDEEYDNSRCDADDVRDRVYWVSGNATTPPRCDSTQWISRSRFYCFSANAPLSTAGYANLGAAAMWRGSPSRWQTLRAGSNSSSVECAADDAIPHGDGTSKLYPTNTSGPFNTNPANKIGWTNSPTNTSYTFFDGNYVNYWFNGRTVTRTRLQIVQDVTRETLAGLTNANVGLMRFDGNSNGGMVLSPVADVATSLATITTQVNALNAAGATPLSETYYEAALYWRGAAVDYGRTSVPVNSVATSRKTSNTNEYQSPAASDCAKNFIVYLTDGLPNQDWGANEKIRTLAGIASCGDRVPVDGGATGSNADSGMCFDDLAKFLYEQDQNPTVGGVQNVTTYTIGFGDGISGGSALLARAAELGGGQYYEAGDTASLTGVLQQIVREILSQNTFFTSPAISVNAFNRTRNLNDLFITMFQSEATFHWPGNLKKYRIKGETGEIVGSDGRPAVDPSTGFFRQSAISFWRETADPVDGADVTKGGAANRLPDPANRKVYTDFQSGDLTANANLVVGTNAAITPELLGLDAGDTGTRDKLVDWVRGADIRDLDEDGEQDDQRNMMGDPLHSQPVSVIYGGTEASPDIDDALVFVATNDGYLHAIDPKTGREKWAFVPTAVLPRMKRLFDDASLDYKAYALDGSLRAFKLDLNNNGIVEPDDGERVYLLFGMGRGGSNYYALDVTVRDEPALLWRIGEGQLPGVGQTWSTPVVARVNIGGATQNSRKLVAIFGGGYDDSQDNLTWGPDSLGNRIYMVDLDSGALLWRAGPSGDTGAQLQLSRMNSSIPADVRTIDLDGDGFVDRMYTADTAARIWRFDVFNGNSAATLVTGGVFASLGVGDGAGTQPTDSRRFYYAPDVSLLRQDGRTFFNIAIGSGWRGSPLNKDILDRFYSIRDYRPFAKLTQAQYDSTTIITESTDGWVDATGVDFPVIDNTDIGWKMDLTVGDGEKALAEARTFGGQVFFTTYTPNATDAVCTVNPGTNRLYVVDALTGGLARLGGVRAAEEGDSDDDGSSDDTGGGDDGGGDDGGDPPPATHRDSKATDLPSAGIASNVVFVFPSADNPDDPFSNSEWCSGSNCPAVPPPRCLVGLLDCGNLPVVGPVRTFWTQQNVDE